MKNGFIVILGVLLALSELAHAVGKEEVAVAPLSRAVYRARAILHQCIPPKKVDGESWIAAPSLLQIDEPIGHSKDIGSSPKIWARGLAPGGANR